MSDGTSISISSSRSAKAGCRFDSVDAAVLVLAALGLTALLLCGFLVIKPYVAQRAFTVTANCTVESVWVGRPAKECSHGACYMVEPCVTVRVRHTEGDGEHEGNQGGNATLYFSIEHLQSKCTTRDVCQLGSWGREGFTGPCYVNPSIPQEVLSQKSALFWGAIHGALWPTVVVFVCVSVFAGRRCSPDIGAA